MPELTITIAHGQKSRTITIPEPKVADYLEKFVAAEQSGDFVGGPFKLFVRFLRESMRQAYIRGDRALAVQATPDAKDLVVDAGEAGENSEG